MTLDTRIVLHIPQKAYIDGVLVDIPAAELTKKLIDRICAAELEPDYFPGCYMTEIDSFYKGREYPERLITVFVPSGKADIILDIFSSWFLENNAVLRQESMAAELNNKMIITSLQK